MTTNNFTTIPIVNISILDLLKNSANIKLDFFKEMHTKYGNTFQLNILDRKAVLSTEPEVAKYILVDNNKNYTKSFAYDIIKIFLGEGLLTAEGEYWKRQRRLAQPAFHKQKLDLMFFNMLTETEKSIFKINRYADTELLFDFNKILYELTLNIVNKTLFYNEVGDTTDAVYDLVSQTNEFITDRINQPIRMPDWVPSPQNLREKKVLKSMDKVFYGIIKRRRNTTSSHEDLLSMLMDAIDEDTGAGMTDKQLRDEILTIFVAGHETTHNALAWIFYLLDKNPEKLEILLHEIDEHITDDKIDASIFRKMPYLKMVIDEGMRIFPPAWILGRKAIEDDNINGYEIKKGTNVLLPIYLIHHDKNIWKNPEKFIPERFESEQIKSRHKYAYFPFGGGPRLCIGNNFAIQEMQVALCLILKRFHVSIDKNFQPEMDPLVTLRQKQIMFAKVSLRK
ncbi:MAG: cytochrome P450 [Chitinophagales bacterium]